MRVAIVFFRFHFKYIFSFLKMYFSFTFFLENVINLAKLMEYIHKTYYNVLYFDKRVGNSKSAVEPIFHKIYIEKIA